MDYSQISRNDFLWVLGCLCRLERIPLRPGAVLREYPPPYTLAVLQQASARLGVKTSLTACESAYPEPPWTGFVHSAVEGVSADGEPNEAPALAKETAIVDDDAKPSVRPALIIEINEGRILFATPDASDTQRLPIDEFDAVFTGTILRFVREPAPVTDPDAMAEAERRFGFHWFIPELLKHRRIWRDVLSASLAIQLMALATPLFTQVVIDKVIVHHTQSTLIVIGISPWSGWVTS